MVTGVFMGLIILTQLSGNGGIIWLLLFKLESDLTVGRTFILSLAISDFTSGLNGIVGAYREDLGRLKFYLPPETFYITFSRIHPLPLNRAPPNPALCQNRA